MPFNFWDNRIRLHFLLDLWTVWKALQTVDREALLLPVGGTVRRINTIRRRKVASSWLEQRRVSDVLYSTSQFQRLEIDCYSFIEQTPQFLLAPHSGRSSVMLIEITILWKCIITSHNSYNRHCRLETALFSNSVVFVSREYEVKTVPEG